MRKYLLSILFFISCFVSAYSTDYFNFTVGFPVGCHVQEYDSSSSDLTDYYLRQYFFGNSYSNSSYAGWEYLELLSNSEKDDEYVVEVDYALGITAEYFHTFGDSSFGIGVKGGFDIGAAGVATTEESSDAQTYLMTGFSIGPSVGWVWGEITNKKINIYPLTFRYANFSDVDDTDYNSFDSNFNTKILKSGASFSWQWGSGRIQNGFEIGFDIDWADIYKTGSNGSGFDVNVAYKLSFVND